MTQKAGISKPFAISTLLLVEGTLTTFAYAEKNAEIMAVNIYELWYAVNAIAKYDVIEECILTAVNNIVLRNIMLRRAYHFYRRTDIKKSVFFALLDL